MILRMSVLHKHFNRQFILLKKTLKNIVKTHDFDMFGFDSEKNHNHNTNTNRLMVYTNDTQQ